MSAVPLSTFETAEEPPVSLWRDAWFRLKRNRLALFGLAVVLVLALAAVFGEEFRIPLTPFVIGACHPDPRISLERVRKAIRLAPTGIQVIFPDWWPVCAEEAIDFLGMAAEAAAHVPLVL